MGDALFRLFPREGERPESQSIRVRLWASAFAGGPSRARRAREGGFTLIEMMVALAVFSLAALALIRLEGATLRSTGILDETLTAQMVARNVAVEALTDAQPPAAGAANGNESNGGRSWSWTRRVTPLGDAGALRIDIAVAPEAGRPIARLMVVRPGA